jgi:hypothetical protein
LISAGYLRFSGHLEPHDDDAADGSDDERTRDDDRAMRTMDDRILISSPRARHSAPQVFELFSEVVR